MKIFNDNYNQLKWTASSLIIHTCVNLKFFTILNNYWQSINCCKHHHLQLTYYFMIMWPYQFQWASMWYQWSAGTNDPSVWVKFSVHIIGNWSTHDSWPLIIRPCIYIHLCCCLATNLRLLECHMYSLSRLNFSGNISTNLSWSCQQYMPQDCQSA